MKITDGAITNETISEYIIRGGLALLGTAGIATTLISCALESTLYFPMFISNVLFCLILSIVVFNSEKTKLGTFIKSKTFATIMTVAGILLVIGFKGITYIVNDIIDAIAKPYGLSLSHIFKTGDSTDKYLVETVGLIAIVYIVSLVSVIMVNYVRSIVVAAVLELWLSVLFISFDVIPPAIPFGMTVIYILGIMAADKKKGSYQATLWVGIIGIVGTVIGITVVSMPGYERPKVFSAVNKYIQEDFNVKLGSIGGGDGKGNSTSDIADAGLSDGTLGKVAKVKYSYTSVMELITQYSRQNQYYGFFYSDTYNNNSWENNQNRESTDYAEISQIIDEIDTNQLYRDRIDDGTGDYEKLVKPISSAAYMKIKDYNVIKNVRYYLDYKTIKKIIELNNEETEEYLENLDSEANAEDKKKLNELYYSSGFYKESLLRKKVYYNNNNNNSFLSVPDHISQVLDKIIDKENPQSFEDKLAYIDKIKKLLAKNYTYTLEPGVTPDDKDFVTYFLTESKKGYCTYFATAAAMMMRYAGIPARYVEGYVVTGAQILASSSFEGSYERYTTFNAKMTRKDTFYNVDVKDTSAHAWVEIYIDGYGWTPIEFTPSSSVTGAQQYDGMSDTTIDVASGNTEKSVEDESPAEEISTEVATESEAGNINETAVYEENTASTKNVLINSNDMKNKAAVTLMIVVIAVSSVIVILASVLIYKYNRIERIRHKRIMRQDVLWMYGGLEKLLGKVGCARPEGMDYEQYTQVLKKINPMFEKYDINIIMEVVLETRFGDNERNAVKMHKACENIEKIRHEVIYSQKKIKRWWLLYIECL